MPKANEKAKDEDAAGDAQPAGHARTTVLPVPASWSAAKAKAKAKGKHT